MDYTPPVDMLLSGEEYGWDHRMPGYSVIYLLTRLIFPTDAAMQALVVL
jgi:hypothetical protein